MNQAAATESVIKKLGALRATLSDEEQAAFDRLVVGAADRDDVEAHAFSFERDNRDSRDTRDNRD